MSSVQKSTSEFNLSDFEKLETQIGSHLGTSSWFQIDQSDIDQFGNLTKDRDAMHMDPVWAQAKSPFGHTIAYGFQTLSMMTAMMNDLLPRGTEEAYKINYGFDRVRLVSPVPAGSRIRGSATLRKVQKRDDQTFMITIEMIVEIDGKDRPAVVSDWLFLVANTDEEERRPDMQGYPA